MASSATSGLLSRQLKQLQSDKDIPGISCGLVEDDIFEWEVMLMISDECKFYGGMTTSPQARLVHEGFKRGTDSLLGGFYKAHLTFPPEYPHLPPKMTFKTPIWHPNGV